MRPRFLALFTVLCLCALGAGVSDAAPIIYSFEAPGFLLGQTTPLLNKPPDAAGPPTFTTSFTDAVDPNGYQITNIPENGLMVGQSLFAPIVTSPLTLTFNTPVTQLSVDFAIDIPNGFPPGFLQLMTPSGTVDQPSSNVGGGNGFQGGTLDFITASPFTTATLQGFFAPGGATQIDIDNLNLTPAPVAEPSTLGLLGLGLAVLAGWRRKRRMPPAI
ncbi:MAG: VPDSG-CTERM sorting domain-containing protein [Alphaproteobacteria bacterium]|nr:VPDSG-CTERM sorting domain-containing protein [Alphaproteobacteria bacterium]